MIDFASRLRRYADKCDFNNWTADKMIKCLVISNMSDEELRLKCLKKDYRLDQVLDKIQLKEDTKAMSKIMGPSSRSNEEKVQKVQGKAAKNCRTGKRKKEDLLKY